MRGNPYVELVHWLHVLLQDPLNDVAAIRTRFQVDDAKTGARRRGGAGRSAAGRHGDLGLRAGGGGGGREGLALRLAPVLGQPGPDGTSDLRRDEDPDPAQRAVRHLAGVAQDPGRPPRRRLQPDRRRLERDRPCGGVRPVGAIWWPGAAVRQRRRGAAPILRRSHRRARRADRSRCSAGTRRSAR